MPLPVSTILNTNAISALSAKSVKTSLCAPLVGKAATSQTRFGRCKNLLNILALCAAAFLAPTQVAFAADPTGPAKAWGALAPPPTLNNFKRCKEVAAGYEHTLALTKETNQLDQPIKGAVFAWGRNYEGQCNVPSDLLVNLKVPGAASFIAAGYYHSVAIAANGKVITWGWNAYGQCGTLDEQVGGYEKFKQLNPEVCANLTGFADLNSVPSDSEFTCGGVPVSYPGAYWIKTIKESGSTFVPLIAREVAAGLGHTVALKFDGIVVAWGLNIYGQCGTALEAQLAPANPNGSEGGTGDSNSLKGTYWVKSSAIGSIGKCLQITAGAYHTAAIKGEAPDAGVVVAWGFNSYLQCGIPTEQILGADSSPYWLKSVGRGGPGPCMKVAGGGFHTAAITAINTVVSWGYNYDGQCGTTYSHPTKFDLEDPLEFIESVNEKLPYPKLPPTTAAGSSNIELSYWTKFIISLNSLGQEEFDFDGSPKLVPLKAMDIAAGYAHTMATNVIDAKGTPPVESPNSRVVFAWGDNSYGQCGDQLHCITRVCSSGRDQDFNYNSVNGAYWTNSTVNVIPNPPNADISVAGTLKAVGPTPGIVVVQGLAAGGYHSVAIKYDSLSDPLGDGIVVAWGANNYGQCDVPATKVDNTDPTNPTYTTFAWSKVAAGYWHTVAIDATGLAVGWGDNTYGQCGDSQPQLSGTNEYWYQTGVACTQIAAGWYHTVAVKPNGTVAAWGAGENCCMNPQCSPTNPLDKPNAYSWPNFTQSCVPASMQDPDTANCIAVSAGAYHTLALKVDGSVMAWGAGEPDINGPVNLFGIDINGIEWGQSCVPPTVLNGAGSPVAWKAKAIAAGAFHSVALLSSPADLDGTVVAWGSGTIIELPDGGWDGVSGLWWGQSIVPTEIKDTNGARVPLKAKAISAGYAHTLAITETGKEIVGWGAGKQISTNGGYSHLEFGQSGREFEANSPGIVYIEVNNDLIFTAVAAGYAHTVAIVKDIVENQSFVVAYGWNDFGQCGTANEQYISGIPTPLWAHFGLGSCFEIAAGYIHTVAIQVPSTLTVASNGTSTTGVVVSWTPVASATTYKVFRDGGMGFTEPSPIAITSATTFTDTSAVVGTLYNYYVKVVTPQGESSAGSQAMGWRNVAAPSEVIATSGEFSDMVRITWAEATGATSYSIYRDGGAIGSTDALAFDDTSAVAGTIYSYTVKAKVGFAISDASVADTGNAGASPCPSDLDGSGVVDSGDVGMVLLDTGECQGCLTDLDGSGFVDSGDVGMVLLDSGPCQ